MTNHFKRAAVVFLLFFLSTSAYLCGFLDDAEHLLTDQIYQSERSIHPNIFIIGIDGDSLDQYGSWGSWSRQLTADLIEYLNADENTKPAVIGVDILFSGHTTEQEDTALVNAVKDGGNVILASQAYFFNAPPPFSRGYKPQNISIQKYEQPFDALQTAADQGIINIFTDRDGFVRKGIYSYPYNNRQIYSFSAQIARTYAEKTGAALPEAPPLDSSGQWYIPFAQGPGEFFGLGSSGTSWVKVMNGEIPRELFADSIVLVGPYASGMRDSFYTSADRSQPMYGLEIHANMVQSLLEGCYKYYVPGVESMLIVFGISLSLYFLFCRFGVRISALVTVGVCAAYYFAALALYQTGGILPLFYPLLTFILIYLTFLITNSIMLTIEKASLYNQMQTLFINCIRTIANAIDAKDPCTSGHCRRVAEYALILGRGLGFNPKDLADLEYSALLHDVGKIGVSDSVLKKNGPLTREEYEEMKTHPVRGALLLGEIKEFSGRITQGARYHHERYDGHGYGEGLAGEDIPLFGRIIAIADAFDAMTQNRPYHNRMPFDKAIDEIEKNLGTQFDPRLAELFIKLMKEHPPSFDSASENDC